MRMDPSELVVAVNPVHHPAPRLTAAVARAGALGVLELPTGDARAAADVLDRAARWTTGRFGVRVRPGCVVPDLPDAVDTVLLADPARSAAEFPGRRVLVEVVDLAEARAAVAAGAAGLVVRGREAGGRVGELSTFVLLQQVLAAVSVPVWAAGGIGPHTAAAAVAGGATGVVLDTQLALFPDAGLPVELTATLDGLDGSETVLHQGHRVLRRRGRVCSNCPPTVSRTSWAPTCGPSSPRSARTWRSPPCSPAVGARRARRCAVCGTP